MVHPSIKERKPITALFIESIEKAMIINDGETSNLSSWLPLFCVPWAQSRHPYFSSR